MIVKISLGNSILVTIAILAQAVNRQLDSGEELRA